MTLYDWLVAFLEGVCSFSSRRRSVWRRLSCSASSEVQLLEDRALLTCAAMGEQDCPVSVVLHSDSGGVQLVSSYQAELSDAVQAVAFELNALIDSSYESIDSGVNGGIDDFGVDFTGDISGDTGDMGGVYGGIDDLGVDFTGDHSGNTGDVGGVYGGIDDLGVDFTGDHSGDTGDVGGVYGGVDDLGVDFTGDHSGDTGDVGGVYGGIDDWGVDFTGDHSGDIGDVGGVYGGIDDWGVDFTGDHSGDTGDVGGVYGGGDTFSGDTDGGDFGGDFGGDESGGDDAGEKPEVSLRVTDGIAWEGPYVLSKADIASFVVTQSLQSELTVSIRVGGDATPGLDYLIEIDGLQHLETTEQDVFLVRFPAGVSEIRVDIRTLMDHDFEPTEMILMTVVPAPHYKVGDEHTGRIDILDRTADLQIGSSYFDDAFFLDRKLEDTPGADLRLNVNDNNRQGVPDMELYYDGMPLSVAQMEVDFVRLTWADHFVSPNDVHQAAGSYLLSLWYDPRFIRIWTIGGTTQNPTWNILKPKQLLLNSMKNFWVEGVGTGRSPILLVWTPQNSPLPLRVVDTVTCNVWHADLDIDSDNNNGLNYPDRSAWEEELEAHEYGLGKLIFPTPSYLLQSPEPLRRLFTPLVVDIRPLDYGSHESAIQLFFRRDGNSGGINIWTVPSDYGGQLIALPVENGGHLITPGRAYTLEEIEELRESGRFLGFWIQAEYVQRGHETKRGVVTYGKPLDRIVLLLKVNRGGSWKEFGRDEVQYMVVAPNSFYPHLQWPIRETSGVVLRDALASEGVYSNPDSDLRHYALKRLDWAEMEELKIPSDIKRRILASDAAGFKATLYRDYVSGDYVLAFAGTETWEDVVEDFWQGIGGSADQYSEAMLIADGLWKVFSESSHGRGVRTTGHSLGGGLASAASVVTGMKANTFNAAGLHRNTLLARDSSNRLTDQEIYEGSLLRFHNAADYITAWYLEFDLLNFLQDHLPPLPLVGRIPAAIGLRRKLIGPYNRELAENSAWLMQRWADLSASVGDYGSYRAWLDHLWSLGLGSDKHRLAKLLYNMALHHTTEYYHYGVMTERDPYSSRIKWDIYGDWGL